MEQNITRICHKICFPNDTSEVSLLPQVPSCSFCPQQSPPRLAPQGSAQQTDTVFRTRGSLLPRPSAPGSVCSALAGVPQGCC